MFQTLCEIMSAVKKVLIPTDFNVKSLNVLLEFLRRNPNDQFEVILAHGYDMSYSFRDLLFYSEYKILKKIQSDEFRESCKLIENTYQSKLTKLRFSILTGSTKSYVKNYVEANNIDLIVCCNDYKMKFKSSDSFNLLPYLKATNVEIINIENTQNVVTELEHSEQLADIFLSSIEQ